MGEVSPAASRDSAPTAVRHASNPPNTPTSNEANASSAWITGRGRLRVKKSTRTSPWFMWQNAKNDAAATAEHICSVSTSPGTGRAANLRPTIETISITTMPTNTKPPIRAATLHTASSARPTRP